MILMILRCCFAFLCVARAARLSPQLQLSRDSFATPTTNSSPILSAFSVEISEIAINNALAAAWEAHLLHDKGEVKKFEFTSSQIVDMLLGENQSWSSGIVRQMTSLMADTLDIECVASSGQIPKVSINAESGIDLIFDSAVAFNMLLGHKAALTIGVCENVEACPLEARRLEVSGLSTQINAVIKAIASGTRIAFDLNRFAFESVDVRLASLRINGSGIPGLGRVFDWLGTQMRLGANALIRFVVDRFLRDLLVEYSLDSMDMANLLTVVGVDGIHGADTMRLADISIKHLNQVLSVSTSLYSNQPVSFNSTMVPLQSSRMEKEKGLWQPTSALPLVLQQYAASKTPTVVAQLSEGAVNTAFKASWYTHLSYEDGKHKDYFLTSEEIASALLRGNDGMIASGLKTLLTSVFTFEASIGVPDGPPALRIDPLTGISLTFAVELALNGILWESVAGQFFVSKDVVSIDARRMPLARMRSKATVTVEAKADAFELSFILHGVQCHDLRVELLGVSSSLAGKIPGIGKALSWLGEKLRLSGNLLTKLAVNHLVKDALAGQKVNLAEMLLISISSKNTFQVQDVNIRYAPQRLVVSAEIHRVGSLSEDPDWSDSRWIDMPFSVKHCLEVVPYQKATDGNHEMICVRDVSHASVGCFHTNVLSRDRPAFCKGDESVSYKERMFNILVPSGH